MPGIEAPLNLSGTPGIAGISGMPGIEAPLNLSGAPGISGISGMPGIEAPLNLSGTPGISDISGMPGIEAPLNLSGISGISGIPGIEAQPPDHGGAVGPRLKSRSCRTASGTGRLVNRATGSPEPRGTGSACFNEVSEPSVAREARTVMES